MSLIYGEVSNIGDNEVLEYYYPKLSIPEIDLKTKVQRLEIEIEELKKVIENLMLIIETNGFV